MFICAERCIYVITHGQNRTSSSTTLMQFTRVNTHGPLTVINVKCGVLEADEI